MAAIRALRERRGEDLDAPIRIEIGPDGEVRDAEDDFGRSSEPPPNGQPGLPVRHEVRGPTDEALPPLEPEPPPVAELEALGEAELVELFRGIVSGHAEARALLREVQAELEHMAEFRRGRTL